jgi:hypothetical protein
MNPLLNMGMGPGGMLSGMHPLANLQNQLQNFALFQVSDPVCLSYDAMSSRKQKRQKVLNVL